MSYLDDLARKYNTDKRTNDPNQNIYHGYTPIYEDLFRESRFDFRNILEIGVWDGRSLNMWYDYFPNALIWGIDNLSSVGCLLPEQINNDRINFLLGDASNDDSVYLQLSNISFDFILDDASHKTDDQVKTLTRYFRLVKPKGYYFIEDLDINQRNIFPQEYIKFIQDVENTQLIGELGVIRKK